MKKHRPAPCPCGLPRNYAECCGPLHSGATAPDAEALMRSRYSAYVLQQEIYLHQTWHPATRPPALTLQQEAQPKWISLEVIRHEVEDADHATVEFVARCKVGGRAQRMHEISRFVRIDGRWLYLDGEQRE